MAEIKWIKKYEKKVRVIPSPPKPKTNADRIRSMSDEELAMWINDLTTNALSVLALGSNKQTKTISHWYDWLRKEADEEEM